MKAIKDIINEEINSYIKEVSDSEFDMILNDYSNERIIISENNNINFNSVIQDNKQPQKPKGLWYGFGDSWLNWVRNEMPEWESDYLFHLKVDQSKVLRLSTYDELIKFSKEYKLVDSNLPAFGFDTMGIDWIEVSKKYSGIEIVPYIFKARLELSWYYSWDVASGCIWNNDAIVSLKNINH